METTPESITPAKSNNTIWIVLGGCCCLSLILILVLVFGFGAYFTFSSSSKPKTTDTSDATYDVFNDSEYSDYNYDEISSDNLNDPLLSGTTGTIEGSLSYPGEKIPVDLKICAENIFYPEKTHCTDKQINDSKYTNSTGYKIEAPVGSYFVYTYQISQPDKKAYYSEFVDCGLKADCPSHEKLIIDVFPNETTDKVDPIDWYAE